METTAKQMASKIIQKETTWQNIEKLRREYMETVEGTSDAFWDGNLYHSTPYLMLEGDGYPVGFYALQQNMDGQVIMTVFYMRKEYLRSAQRKFEAIISQHEIDAALVPSFDELYLSLTMEKMKEWSLDFNMQAYLFEYNDENHVRGPEYGTELVESMDVATYEEVKQKIGEEWLADPLEDGAELYCIRKENEEYGYASVAPHKLNPMKEEIRIYIPSEYRRKGIGRSLLIHLTHEVLSKGKTPTVGCSYYNHECKRMIQSSGYISKTRLFYVKFQKVR